MIEPIAIDDLADPRVADYRDIRDRDLRGREGLFIGEQALVVQEMLARPGVTKSVLVTPPHLERIAPLVPDGVPLYVAPMAVMQGIAGFNIHRGVLAVGYRAPFDSRTLPDIVPPFGSPGCILACESITHMDNIGLLMRNAAAFGVRGMLLDRATHDPLYRKAVRVSIGHVLTVPWVWSQDWLADLAQLRDVYGFTIIGAALARAAVPLDDLPPPTRTVLIVGTESHGLTSSTVAACDHIVRIPMAPGVDSLSVGVAAAVCLHHLCRAGLL